MNDRDTVRLSLWKIVASIHTFSGSIMISTISLYLQDKVTPNPFFFSLGIILFLLNFSFLFIYYDFRNGIFRRIVINIRDYLRWEMEYLELAL